MLRIGDILAINHDSVFVVVDYSGDLITLRVLIIGGNVNTYTVVFPERTVYVMINTLHWKVVYSKGQ